MQHILQLVYCFNVVGLSTLFEIFQEAKEFVIIFVKETNLQLNFAAWLQFILSVNEFKFLWNLVVSLTAFRKSAGEGS